MTLDDILARLGALPENEKQEIEAEALKATARRYFVPNVGPQTQAYFSQADEVFYGGGAGGGKSALLCGLAIEEHRKAIIFRREYPQIKSLVDNAAGFFCYQGRQGRVGSRPVGNLSQTSSISRLRGSRPCSAV
jgi:hypothetical protein